VRACTHANVPSEKRACKHAPYVLAARGMPSRGVQRGVPLLGTSSALLYRSLPWPLYLTTFSRRQAPPPHGIFCSSLRRHCLFQAVAHHPEPPSPSRGTRRPLPDSLRVGVLRTPYALTTKLCCFGATRTIFDSLGPLVISDHLVSVFRPTGLCGPVTSEQPEMAH